MTNSSTSQAVDTSGTAPALMRLLTGFWIPQALYVVADLGIAELLRDYARSAEELAEATGSHAPTLHRLLRALASVGVFAEEADGRFSLAPTGLALCRDVPGSVRTAVEFFASPPTWAAWGALLQVVQTGSAAFEQQYGQPLFSYMAQQPAYGARFDAFMTGSSDRRHADVATVYDFSRFRTVVDVGGGQGILLARVLATYPSVRGILFDLPHVIAGAEGILATAGVADRCTVVGGDFFAGVPSDGDAYLLSGVLHDWPDERALAIVQRCAQAMPLGGTLLAIDRVLPVQAISPMEAFMDLNMHVLLGGKERTEVEWRTLLGAAGFAVQRTLPLPAAGRSVIEAVSNWTSVG